MTLNPPSSKGSSGGGGGLTLIQTITLGADGVIDFTAIPATFKHLQLLGIIRGTRGATAEFLAVTFNADAGANYEYTILQGLASSALASSEQGKNNMFLSGEMPAASAGAGKFESFVFFVPNYAATTQLKTIQCTGAGGGGNTVSAASVGRWTGTAAINQITFFGGSTTNLLAGSTLSLYGIPVS